jgi:hypothetical protein
MSGGKLGLVQNVMQFLSKVGMSEEQTKNLILRTLDPAQTDQVVTELARYVGGPDKAMEIIAILREAQARGTGSALATEPE